MNEDRKVRCPVCKRFGKSVNLPLHMKLEHNDVSDEDIERMRREAEFDFLKRVPP